MKNKKAVIISLKGSRLSEKETSLFKNEKPWGVILFKRNVKNYNQLVNLIKSIRKISKDKKFPVLIDEEGETVSRLKKIFNHKFNAKKLGEIFKYDPITTENLYKHYINNLTKILKSLGINVNTVPVLDVLRKGTNKIIGSRSFSQDPKIVKKLGAICVEQYKKNKIATVIKHIPGHGCATVDSHKDMPVVKLNYKNLNSSDFLPFKLNKSLFAMTAHILYKKIDNKNVATFSKKIISKVIRKEIGFKGILISDDISMKALKHDLITNAKKSISAGCNLVLYCGGNYKHSLKLLRTMPIIDKFTVKKTSEFYQFLS